MSRNLVVFVVDNLESRRVWEWAQHHSVREGDHVTLLTVAWQAMPMLGVATCGGDDASVDAVEISRKEAHKRANEFLQELKHAVTPKGWTLDVHVLKEGGGSVGDTICDYLKRHKETDEAIIGQRPMGAFKKTMLALVGQGSVSDYVVRHSPCSVLVVRHSCTSASDTSTPQ